MTYVCIYSILCTIRGKRYSFQHTNYTLINCKTQNKLGKGESKMTEDTRMIMEAIGGLQEQMRAMDKRMDRMEQRLDRMDERMDHMEQRLDR